jgi:hypothetical protein
LHLPQHLKSAARGANVPLLNHDVQQLFVTLLFLGGITGEHGVATKEIAVRGPDAFGKEFSSSSN